jgi:hypothetical protein
MRRAVRDADQASLIALKALAYIAEDEERLSRFLVLTGVEADYVPTAMESPEFQAAVLEYLMTDEPTLLAFCAVEQIEPETPAAALNILTGPAGESDR